MSTPERSPTTLGPLDAVRADPDHHEVLLENEHVRVLDALVAPGEQTAIHTHVWRGPLESSVTAFRPISEFAGPTPA